MEGGERKWEGKCAAVIQQSRKGMFEVVRVTVHANYHDFNRRQTMLIGKHALVHGMDV